MIMKAVQKSDFGLVEQSMKMKVQEIIKKSGNFGFPIQFLTMLNQLFFKFWEMIYMGLLAYKEMWLSMFFLIVPLPKKNLHNEIAVVVGSSRGLGREIALRLAKCKANVICIDVQSSDQETTSKEIVATGGTVKYFQCDVTNKDQVEKVICTITKEIGDVTMLYHCCSLPVPSSTTTNPPSTKQIIDVSVTSYFYLLELILPHMKSNGKGHIIFLTSVAVITGFSQQLAVNVSQFAVQGLYESVVEELRVAKLDNVIKTTLVHIYPFIVNARLNNALSLRLPGFFGSIRDDKAADRIVNAVRKNKTEISIPSYGLTLSNFLKLFPRTIVHLVRNFLDAGLDI